MKEFMKDLKELADNHPDVKFYTIAHHNDGENLNEHRVNKGFHPFYLLGLLETTQLSIIRQVNASETPPDIITKEVILNEDGE